MYDPRYHSFYIPVMGTGFTIDSPLKVAKYGISSSISMVDDVFIEQMRKHHATEAGLPYQLISERDHDCRAKRITSYLNLVNHLVENQMDVMRTEPFNGDSDISKYFQYLPSTSSLKKSYEKMMTTSCSETRKDLEKELRLAVKPGRIDVNIMTKVDAIRKKNLNSGLEFPSDALCALRGYAESDLESAVIFSAGLNPRLYGYTSKFADFYPDKTGFIKKKIILKVSDFRSALVQGKYFAKQGLWVSEFRVESGLNCGGHAFASSGNLMGPILRDFVEKRQQLKEKMEQIWRKSLAKMNILDDLATPDINICAQGGVGNAEEHQFLIEHFGLNEIGWGSPFLLVPEATNVDETHLEKLMAAEPHDIVLSDSSPLGIPFWNLKGSASEDHRRELLDMDKPGSLCPKQYAITNTQFTEHAICTASRQFQKLKMDELETMDVTPLKKESLLEKILGKSCICHDLAGVATVKLNLVKKAFPAICCGPNIAFFDRVSTLKTMIDHIYGRISLFTNTKRPNMFINELRINFDWIASEFDAYKKHLSDRPISYFETFKANLSKGIEEYKTLAEEMIEEHREVFLRELRDLELRIDSLFHSLQEATV